jgi:hypothetical protein
MRIKTIIIFFVLLPLLAGAQLYIGQNLWLGETIPPSSTVNALPIDFMLNLNNVTPGTLVTTGALNSATMSDTTFGTTSWNIIVDGSSTLSQSTFLSNTNLGYSLPLLYNGSVIYGSSNSCLLFTNKLPSSTYWESLQCNFNGIISNTPVLIYFRTRALATIAQQDLVWASFNGGWVDAQFYSGTLAGFQTHGQTNSVSTYSGVIATTTTSNYNVLLKGDPNYNVNGESEIAVFDQNWNLIGSAQAPSTVNNLLENLWLQSYLNYTGGSNYLGPVSISISNNATVPSWMFSVPAPNSLAVYEVWTNQVNLTWNQNGIRSEIDRSTNGGTTWIALATNVEPAAASYNTNTAFSYTDNTVTNGVTYTYRVNANAMEVKSVFTNASVTVVAPYSPPTPDLAYWVGSGSGGTLTDTVGGHNATLGTGATWVTGPDGMTDALEGDTTHAIATNLLAWAVGTNKITVSVWVNQPSVASSGAPEIYFSSGPAGNGNVIGEGDFWYGEISGSVWTDYNQFYVFFDNIGAINNWHNIVYVFDNSSSIPSVTCYLDGMNNPTTGPNTSEGLAGNYGSFPWSLGGYIGDSNPLNGSIAFVRVYSGDQSKYAQSIYMSKK